MDSADYITDLGEDLRETREELRVALESRVEEVSVLSNIYFASADSD